MRSNLSHTQEVVTDKKAHNRQTCCKKNSCVESQPGPMGLRPGRELLSLA